jgi:hypothetical protein
MTEHFATLVRRYARAAISGVMPKFIAQDVAHDALPLGKPTLRTGFHIIKGSDDTTPYLGFNEFYTMRVLERLQVMPVATCRMSEDGRVLVVDRFDVDENGLPRCGLEDACGLLGLPPHEKYATTTERVWNATRAYIPGERLREPREHFGWRRIFGGWILPSPRRVSQALEHPNAIGSRLAVLSCWHRESAEGNQVLGRCLAQSNFRQTLRSACPIFRPSGPPLGCGRRWRKTGVKGAKVG